MVKCVNCERDRLPHEVIRHGQTVFSTAVGEIDVAHWLVDKGYIDCGPDDVFTRFVLCVTDTVKEETWYYIGYDDESEPNYTTRVVRVESQPPVAIAALSNWFTSSKLCVNCEFSEKCQCSSKNAIACISSRCAGDDHTEHYTVYEDGYFTMGLDCSSCQYE